MQQTDLSLIPHQELAHMPACSPELLAHLQRCHTPFCCLWGPCLTLSSFPAAALQACTSGVDLCRQDAADRAAAATRRARRARAAANGHMGGERLTPEPGMDDASLVVQPEALPAKLLNNAAVLHMAAGEAGKALQLLEEAVQVPAFSGLSQQWRSCIGSC